MAVSADERREAYRTKLCHVMAIALSRLTGLPLGLLVGERLTQDVSGERKWGLATEYDYGHAVVIVDADRAAWMDVDGVHLGFGAAAFRFSTAVDKIMILPANEEGVTLAFRNSKDFHASPISTADINRAFQFIFADPDLTAVIESLKFSSKVAISPDRTV